jgi:hypothetical protein
MRNLRPTRARLCTRHSDVRLMMLHHLRLGQIQIEAEPAPA